MKYFVAYSVLDNQTDEQVVIKRCRFEANSYGEAKSLAEFAVCKVAAMASQTESWYGVALREDRLSQDDIYVSVHEWEAWGERLDENWEAIKAYTPELGDEDD